MRSPRLSGSETRNPILDASHTSSGSYGSGSSSGSGSTLPSSSSSSSSSSFVSSPNRVRIAVRAIGSCFGSPRARDHPEEQQLNSSSRTPLVNIHSSERRRSGKGPYVSSHNHSPKESVNRTFTMADILKATKNFSPSLTIGQGGFGTVYKGRLDDGTIVAVKRARKSDFDHHLSLDFKREIQTMALIEHLNLDKFFGFLENEDEKIIVIEYVPNVTLLLCSVLVEVKGSAGYLDPDYLQTYQLTEKSDVYSFGVLLVELVTGRRPIEPKREIKERITVKWAIGNFMDGNLVEVLDPNLKQSPATNFAVEKIVELALQCLPLTRQSRPIMKRCAEVLWGIRKDYGELLSSDALNSDYFENPSVNSSEKE